MVKALKRVTGLLLAATAAASISTVAAAPAHAASWSVYRVYASSSTCEAAGKAAIATNYAQDYDCRWDSPGFALWLYR
jgi:spermidine/putrescine-binding protein